MPWRVRPTPCSRAARSTSRRSRRARRTAWSTSKTPRETRQDCDESTCDGYRPGAARSDMKGLLRALDRSQKGSRPAAVAVATFKKFSEDKSTRLASMIAFWGFFSIFPLLLVLVTLLGWFLPGSDRASV